MAYIGENQILFNAQIHGLVNIDNEYNPESENPQSGIAVAQALNGASGVKVITEEINAGDLDYGIYYIDGNNGGSLNVPGNYFASGTIFVSPDVDLGGKQISVLGIEPNLQTPTIVSYFFDEEGNFADIYDEFVSRTYVDASVNRLQKQIDELKTPTDDTPTVHTEIELNNKGELWFDINTADPYTKSNDGWCIVGNGKTNATNNNQTTFIIVGETIESVATTATSTKNGTVEYGGKTYHFVAKVILDSYIADTGKCVSLDGQIADNTTLATKLLDYYYGV